MGHYYCDLCCPGCGQMSKECSCDDNHHHHNTPVCRCPDGILCQHRKRELINQVYKAFETNRIGHADG